MAFKTIESDVNAHAGVAGHKLQIILTNDQGNPTTAVTLAQQLVSEHVAGIVYPGFPASAAQTIPYFDKQQVPVVFADPPPTGSNSDPYYFNTFATTAQQYQVLAEYIKQKAPSVALISDTSQFGKISATVDAAAKAANLPVKATTYFNPTAVDVTTQLLQAKKSGATALAAVPTMDSTTSTTLFGASAGRPSST
jgi:branched-chain amino acid transport system substrate-binding protein